ncbi:membrane bound O-acyl transferase family-domain-containing protein [Mucidula mucida]|nr:membrane bound O-acyl transferase family-domain-containing protein [Mucidula mucida]
MSDRAPFHPLYHIILPEFLLVFALACNPPQRWRVLLFLGFCYATGLALQSTTGDILQDYTLGTFITAQWFTALRLLLLADPLSEYRHVADDIHPTQYGLLYRGYWCACVIHSVCGLGWNFQCLWQMRHIFKRPSSEYPRWKFVRSRLTRVLWCILLLDAAQSYMTFNPSVFRHADAESVASQGYWRRCLNIFIAALNPYCGLSFPYYLVSALHVAIGFSQPMDWPDPFGSVKEAYTIRRFWTKFWHQLMNRNVIVVGRFVTRSLDLKRHSWSEYLTGVSVGFLVSGVIHIGGDVMAGMQHVGKSLPFFLLQAAGIAVEQGCIHLLRGMGVRGSGFYRWLGRLWVCLWFSVSAVGFVDWGIHVGFFYKDALPFSPVRYIISHCVAVDIRPQ